MFAGIIESDEQLDYGQKNVVHCLCNDKDRQHCQYIVLVIDYFLNIWHIKITTGHPKGNEWQHTC
jgi:hypothetical protein